MIPSLKKAKLIAEALLEEEGVELHGIGFGPVKDNKICILVLWIKNPDFIAVPEWLLLTRRLNREMETAVGGKFSKKIIYSWCYADSLERAKELLCAN